MSSRYVLIILPESSTLAIEKPLKALDANIHIKATRNVGYTLEMIDV